jgi:hypothetical protein
MPVVQELKQSLETDNIGASLEATKYSYPDMRLAQFLDGMHSPTNILLEYMTTLLLNKRSGDLQRKINAMSKLSPNWDTYEAEPPSTEAMNLARELLVLAEREKFLPTDAVASAEGGVALSFTVGDRYADIECLNSGEILAVTVVGQQEPYVWEVKKNAFAFADAVKQIRNHFRA